MRKTYRHKRTIAWFLLATFSMQVFYIPVQGQTSQIESTENQLPVIEKYVDLFTGDFRYNLPLLDLPGPHGGFPISLAYQSGVNAETQASWVGLGWNLSAGSIERELRGIPDEFAGDLVHATLTSKPVVTVGVGAGTHQEVLGRSVENGKDEELLRLNFNLYHNSRRGLGYQLDRNYGYQRAIQTYRDIQSTGIRLSGFDNQAPFLGLPNPALLTGGEISFPYQIENETTTTTIKAGNSWAGTYANGYITGYYNVQKFVRDGERIGYPAYGYLHTELATQGSVTDIYNASVQFLDRSEDLPQERLMSDLYFMRSPTEVKRIEVSRSDVGVVHIPTMTSNSRSLGVGSDKAPTTHNGINKSMFLGSSYVGKWRSSESVSDILSFQQNDFSASFSPWKYSWNEDPYASVSPVLDSDVSTEPLRFRLDSDENNAVHLKKALESLDRTYPVQESLRQEVGNQKHVVQAFQNHEIVDAQGQELIKAFGITYLSSSGQLQKFSRNDYPDHHLAGFSTLDGTGVQYYYALPAYVTAHEETTFQAEGTSSDNPSYNFNQHTELAQYASSFLLTAIVGTDYVDVTGNGVTEDDLGYWVKFTYEKGTPKTEKKVLSNGTVTITKETWNLALAETSTHMARFVTQKQEGGSADALQSISLYSRLAGESHPIETVKFDYDYSLRGESLTLRKVWTEEGTSTRGSASPYTFDYHDFNPSLSEVSRDQWGNTIPLSKDPLISEYWGTQVSLDKHLAAWNLTSILAPGGQRMDIAYESDAYGYVGHQIAKQKVRLASEKDMQPILDSDLKVRFELRNTPSQDLDAVAQEKLVADYLGESEYVNFNLYVNLGNQDNPSYDFVTGSAKIDTEKGFGLEKDAKGVLKYGYFYLALDQGYHPFSKSAWNHLGKHPELLGAPISVVHTVNESEQVQQIKQLATSAGAIRKMYEGFEAYCSTHELGRQLDTRYSTLTLVSADQPVYGGGLRVKQLTFNDGWKNSEEGIYGYFLDYTEKESDFGVSSGVASGNPAFDKDAVVGYGQVSVFSLASAYRAGYHVLNIRLSDGKSLFPQGEGVSFGTLGVDRYQYYTAREFPEIKAQTIRDNRTQAVRKGQPLVDEMVVEELTATQGYSTITNNMHGKLKKVAHYSQLQNGSFAAAPNSFTQYDYATIPKTLEGKNVLGLANKFISNGDGTISLTDEYEGENSISFGQREEWLVSLNEYETESWRLGYDLNVDDVSLSLLSSGVLPISIFTKNVSASQNKSVTRLAVTQRKIYQQGILKQIEYHSNGRSERLEFEKLDALTGEPVLIKKTKGASSPVYEKVFMAHHQYRGMGSAAENSGYRFLASHVVKVDDGRYQFSLPDSRSRLFSGDEIILYNTETGTALGTGVYMGQQDGVGILSSEALLEGSDSYYAQVIRSGHRNQLEIQAGRIQALQEPVFERGQTVYTQSLIVPKN